MQGGTQAAAALCLSTTHLGSWGSEQNTVSFWKTASPARAADWSRGKEVSEVLSVPELILWPLMFQFCFTTAPSWGHDKLFVLLFSDTGTRTGLGRWLL